MQEKSYEILSRHPLNIERVKKGLNPANSLWFWGAGTKPALSSFYEKYHKRGVMISAVDLLKELLWEQASTIRRWRAPTAD